MEVSLDKIKQLREKTQVSISDCRSALIDANGDIKKAQDILKERMKAIAAKKTDRVTSQGRIASYVHFDSKIGVLVEVNSETDFVARNEEFCKFSQDVALHIAASNPEYVKKEDVPKEALEAEEDKDAFLKAKCLLEQNFVKDPSLVIKDYLINIIAKTGENVSISRFVRYHIGK
ncbi:MAG: elongation factor Ts [Candidatus Gygaella obscura]|nr:elongation factor Ts [Candidatus Gygaella obscura]